MKLKHVPQAHVCLGLLLAMITVVGSLSPTQAQTQTIIWHVPALAERSDLFSNCTQIAQHRSISLDNITGGITEATVFVDAPSALGMVDNNTASYPPCNEFGEVFFSAGWLVSASVSSSFGLSVIENGQVQFVQNVPYYGETASIQVENKGTLVKYYLDGDLVFQSTHTSMATRDLRGYYFGSFADQRVGIVIYTFLPGGGKCRLLGTCDSLTPRLFLDR